MQLAIRCAHRRLLRLALIPLCLAATLMPLPLGAQTTGYLGFDRNGYPGDSALAALRSTFTYTGLWLNNPPGEHTNTWQGKRALLRQHGFGFLVLFNGRTDAELKATQKQGRSAAALGAEDGGAAVKTALREGFAPTIRIFLDQEEGGRLLPEQAAYIFAWIDAVREAGARTGVYCSGIEVPEGASTISTARDLLTREQARQVEKPSKDRLQLWVANDQCPPSPGCAIRPKLPAAGVPASLAEAVSVWQYAQSPRRPQFSAGCPANAAADGNCYAPGLAHSPDTFLDLNMARSPDPSEAP